MGRRRKTPRGTPVREIPPGTAVRLAALPEIRGIVLRHGDMATLLRLEEPAEVAGKPITRRVTVLWSGQAEVVPG